MAHHGEEIIWKVLKEDYPTNRFRLDFISANDPVIVINDYITHTHYKLYSFNRFIVDIYVNNSKVIYDGVARTFFRNNILSRIFII